MQPDHRQGLCTHITLTPHAPWLRDSEVDWTWSASSQFPRLFVLFGMSNGLFVLIPMPKKEDRLCFHTGTDLTNVYSWGWVGRTPTSLYCLFVWHSPECSFLTRTLLMLFIFWCKFCQLREHLMSWLWAHLHIFIPVSWPPVPFATEHF